MTLPALRSVTGSPSVGGRPVARRTLLAGLGLGVPAGLLGWEIKRRHAVLPLLQADWNGPDVPGWLEQGTIPAVGALGRSTMIGEALSDLHRLTLGGAVPVAGDAGPWRYVWPRDSAFVASALARTGHQADAVAIIDFLQRVQAADGTFQARYRPDTGHPPDDRGIQLDGTGWALWATRQVAVRLPAAERAAFLADHDQLISRSGRLLLRLAGSETFPVSPDYWEVPESRPTLATAALLAVGLDAAAALAPARGSSGQDLALAATRFRERIHDSFGRQGYPRELGGPASSVDLGVAFLLPPFAPTADPAVLRAWRTVPQRLRRPAGGLAPGGSWKPDGISWSNATATAAITDAAVGDADGAIGWLRWLDRHRTADGAIPEKVLWDGRPASVAPLSWSAAAVVIAAALLG